MLRKFCLVILIATLGLPASAQQWADVLQGQTIPNGVWSGSQPVPGVNCPATSSVYPLVYQNGDTDASHYSVVSGALTYTPPAPPAPPPPVANAQLMENSVIADTTISEATKLLLVPYFPSLIQNQSNGALIQPLWTALVNKGVMTPAEVTTIQGYATTYLVPLVP